MANFPFFSHLLMSENIWKREGSPRLVMNTGLEQESTTMEGLARHSTILDIPYYQVTNHIFQNLSRI